MPVFASGAQLVGGVVQAPQPGTDVPPTAPAPVEPVAESTASAPESPAPPTGAETPAEMPDADADAEALEEPEADEQLVLPPTNRGQRRFVSNLIRENERFKAEMEQLRQQNSVLFQQLQSPPAYAQPPAPPAPQAVPSSEPQRGQYPDEASYVNALVDHRLTQARRAEQWQNRLSQGAQRYADFEQVINNPAANPAPHLRPLLYEAACGSEHGDALLYTLGTNLPLLQHLNSLPPREAEREIWRLEGRLALQAPTPPPPAPARPQRPQAAPTPTPPAPPRQVVSGGGTPAQVGGFRPGMSVREYEALRREQRRR